MHSLLTAVVEVRERNLLCIPSWAHGKSLVNFPGEAEPIPNLFALIVRMCSSPPSLPVIVEVNKVAGWKVQTVEVSRLYSDHQC